MEILQKIKLLPKKPGVYQFKDNLGKVIYIGKAKNLRNRVGSYFLKSADHSGRTRVMIKRAIDVSFMVVESELDALLLENSLIKQYQPRYNVMLKDDKTYPWICIKHEPFPRIFATRTKIDDGSLYFGPYASVKMMRTVLGMLRQVYRIRTCNLDLRPSQIAKGRFKVCLEYHIGNCLGPCEARQSETEYMAQIDESVDIIKGHITQVVRILQQRMHLAAERLEFELAQDLKDKIDALQNYQSKSTVVNAAIGNVDVLTLTSDLHHTYVNYLKVIEGAIVRSHTLTYRTQLEEQPSKILDFALAELSQSKQGLAKDILVELMPETELPNHHFSIPKIGDKKKLLELSQRNAKYFMLDKQRQTRFSDPEAHASRLMEQMKKDLRLTELPEHIECFDNSNFHGTNAVAACVVFRHGKPSKKDYRHFNIKTVVGSDDFASMREVVYRRYKRMLEEAESLPQLIVIDGGKGQLSAALESLDLLGIRGKIAIIGIAKKLEEIYYPGDSVPLFIDKRSETLRTLQQLRDEAHRFGITHHRNKRSKAAVQTELTQIPGIGQKLAEKLLREFQSIARLRKAEPREIEAILGKTKTAVVLAWLKSID